MTKTFPPPEDIVALAAQGLTNERIADRLGMSSPTLHAHRKRVPELEEGMRRARAQLLSPCGTAQAYQRHLEAGEPADAACRRAHSARQLANNHRRREAAGLPPPRPWVRKTPVTPAVEPVEVPEQIEQALASGMTVSKIMARFGVDYAAVKAIRDHLEALSFGDTTDTPAPAATPPVPQAVAGTVEPTAAPATRTDNGGPA